MHTLQILASILWSNAALIIGVGFVMGVAYAVIIVIGEAVGKALGE